MNLVPIIYTTLSILAFIAFVIIVGSYFAYKIRSNKKKGENSQKEPKPIYYTYVETEPRITTSIHANSKNPKVLPQLDYHTAIKNSFVKNSSIYYPNLKSVDTTR